MDYVLIKQPSGLGDIFYIQKIVCKVNEKYEPTQIIWPLCDEYYKVKDYFILPKNINFVNENEDFLGKDLYQSEEQNIIKNDQFIYMPLQYSHFALYGGMWRYIMQAKYEIVGLTCEDWDQYVTLNRNLHKEDELFNKKINFSGPYNVINKHWGAGTPLIRTDINIESNLPLIEVNYEQGYTLFDWIKILQNAQTVHTIETSLSYILHMIKKKDVFLYYRIESTSEKNNPLLHAWKNFEYCHKIYTNPNWVLEKW